MHAQAVGGVDAVEPMVRGLSAILELQSVHSGVQMRSDLVFRAMRKVSNRYLLIKLATKAVRGMHIPGVRIEDTTNDVLERFSRTNPIGCNHALAEPQPAPLGPKMTLPVMPNKSKVVTLTGAGEESSLLWGDTASSADLSLIGIPEASWR
jgi:hypothetical protein